MLCPRDLDEVLTFFFLLFKLSELCNKCNQRVLKYHPCMKMINNLFHSSSIFVCLKSLVSSAFHGLHHPPPMLLNSAKNVCYRSGLSLEFLLLFEKSYEGVFWCTLTPLKRILPREFVGIGYINQFSPFC